MMLVVQGRTSAGLVKRREPGVAALWCQSSRQRIVGATGGLLCERQSACDAVDESVAGV